MFIRACSKGLNAQPSIEGLITISLRSMYVKIELKNRRTFDLILVYAHIFFIAHATLGEDTILTRAATNTT